MFVQISLHATTEGKIADVELKASKMVEVVTTGSLQEKQKLHGELRTVNTLSTHSIIHSLMYSLTLPPSDILTRPPSNVLTHPLMHISMSNVKQNTHADLTHAYILVQTYLPTTFTHAYLPTYTHACAHHRPWDSWRISDERFWRNNPSYVTSN